MIKDIRDDVITEKNAFGIYSIAIDGPSGSGKSTVAKTLAKKLEIIYVDTGAMYRTVALYCLKNNINPCDGESVERNVDNIEIQLRYIDNAQRIFLFEEDVSDIIRTQEVADASSKVAQYGKVRGKLIAMQRKIALVSSVVMDGRDIGSFVLPNATLKIYLDASVEIRTNRRINELKEHGIEADFEMLKNEIAERDYRDKNRDISPLVQAKDAIYIDSSDMDINKVEQKIIELLNKKG